MESLSGWCRRTDARDLGVFPLCGIACAMCCTCFSFVLLMGCKLSSN
jgi:hypothetical protein